MSPFLFMNNMVSILLKISLKIKINLFYDFSFMNISMAVENAANPAQPNNADFGPAKV